MPRKRMYVVSGSRGEYSDRHEWNVCAFSSEKEAQEFTVECQQAARSAAAAYRARDPEGNLYGDEQDKLVAECNKLHPDPFFSVDGWGADKVSYYCGVLHIGVPPTRAEWEADLAEIQAKETA